MKLSELQLLYKTRPGFISLQLFQPNLKP